MTDKGAGLEAGACGRACGPGLRPGAGCWAWGWMLGLGLDAGPGACGCRAGAGALGPA